MEIVIVISIAIMLTIVLLLVFKKRKSEKNIITDSPEPVKEPDPVLVSNSPEVPNNTIEFESNNKNTGSVEAVVIRYALTGRENEVYKEKLQDPLWKNKSKEIKKRDGFKCQQCSSSGDDLIELENIDDIKYYVDFPEVAEIVKTVFNNRKKYIEEIEQIWVAQNDSDQNDLNHFLHASSCLPNEKTEYYAEYEIFKIPVIWKHYSIWDFKYFEREFLVKNNVEIPYFIGNSQNIEVSEFRYKTKEPSNICNKVSIEYFPTGNTNGKIYVRGGFEYSNLKYPGQGILTIDGFSIVYPLYKLSYNKLNVHHKAYYEDLEPWDSRIDHELITLCKKCHTEAHKAVNYKIPVKKLVATL